MTYELEVGIKCYIDNSLIGTDSELSLYAPDHPDANPNTSGLALARNYADVIEDGVQWYPSINVDKVAIWDRVLTAEERALL